MKKTVEFITNENTFAVLLTVVVISMICLLKYQDSQEKIEKEITERSMRKHHKISFIKNN